MTASRRLGWALVAALCCAGLLSLTVPSAGARARPRGRAQSAHVAGCSSGQGGSSFSFGNGGRVLSQLDVPVCVTGRLTVSFAGDPADGCAAEGLCDYSGSDTFAPDGAGDLSLVTVVHHGHRSTSGTLFLGSNGSPATSAVQRTVSTATGTQTTACSDATADSQDAGGEFFALTAIGGRITIDLADTQTPLLGSRCAGPLEADVTTALPSRSVSVRTLERGGTSIALTGGGPFAAHGLSGTVSSTLSLSLGRPSRELETPTRTRAATHVHAVLIGTSAYRITGLSGSAVATVGSSATPAVCGPFDACGLGGTITVLPGATVHGSAFLSTVSPGGSRRQLRAALSGSGSAAHSVEGAGSATVEGSVQAVLTQDGTCSDTVSLRQFAVTLRRIGDRLRITLAPSVSQAVDPLRTRCPGPELGSHVFTSAVLPASTLRRRAFTVALRGRPFSDGPYAVSTDSTLSLTLRRTETRVHVIHVVTVKTVGVGVSRGG